MKYLLLAKKILPENCANWYKICFLELGVVTSFTIKSYKYHPYNFVGERNTSTTTTHRSVLDRVCKYGRRLESFSLSCLGIREEKVCLYLNNFLSLSLFHIQSSKITPNSFHMCMYVLWHHMHGVIPVPTPQRHFSDPFGWHRGSGIGWLA